MKNRICLFLVLFATFFGSCVTPKDTNYLQDIKKGYPKEDVAPADYKIIPGDQLLLSVYTLKESTRSLFAIYSANISSLNSGNIGVTAVGSGGGVADLPNNVLNVYSNGTINIPYIGRIEVQNMTVFEAKKAIEDQFRVFYPDVSVDIALRNRSFFVLGEAGSSSIQMTSMRMTIYQALALSGTITPYGNRANVKIIRQTASGTEVKTFDLRSKDIVDSEYYYIQPNDVIYVQQMQRRFWGSITSFTSIFGFITGLAGMITLIVKLTK
ncbi:polysaccharide biosynthesis/export family protein [Viscerimonas tarda]